MKKIALLFIILPFIGFAQIREEIKSLDKNKNQYTTSGKTPTFMVNDSLVDKNIAVKLNLDLIQNIKIIKDDPKYPDGLIKIRYTNK